MAAVTIKTLTHDGLVDMAIKAGEGYKTAEQKELEEMNKISDSLNGIISGNGSSSEKDPVVITGVITFGELTWNNKKASVTINKATNDNLDIEYQVLDKNNQIISDYQTIVNGGTVSNLNLGDFVIARLTDGSNHGNTATIEVTESGKPTPPTFGMPVGEKKNESGWFTGDVTVSITPGTDSESGILKTTYSINGGAEIEGTNVVVTSEGTNTITAYTYDNAGHKTESIPLIINIDKTNPPKVDLSYSSKDYTSVTVNTSITGTDSASGIAKYVFEYKQNSESNWITVVEETSLPTSYPFSDLSMGTAYNFRVSTVDNAGNKNSTGTNVNQTTNEYIFTEEDVGKTVNYIPKANQSYTVDPEFSGSGSSQIFNTSDIAEGWSLWGTDDENIYVISNSSTKVTSKRLHLGGVKGYNNGVTLLDSVCDTCFTDKEMYPGMKGQSLKLEQVLAVASSSATNTRPDYGMKPNSYCCSYPYIWDTYEKSDTTKGQGAKDWETNRSIAYPLTTETTTSSQTYSPYSNYYYNNSMDTSSAWVNVVYYRMVLDPAQDSRYWLSSRMTAVYLSTQCTFTLQTIGPSGINDSTALIGCRVDRKYGVWCFMGGASYSNVPNFDLLLKTK